MTLIFHILTTGTGPKLEHLMSKAKNHSKANAYKDGGQKCLPFFFSGKERFVIFKSSGLCYTDVKNNPICGAREHLLRGSVAPRDKHRLQDRSAF